MTIDFEWEQIGVSKRSRGKKSKENEVWLTSHRKDGLCDRFHVAYNLVDALCWCDGTRVNLYKNKGGSLFMMRQSNVGLITLRQKGKATWFQSVNTILDLNVPSNGTEYDAWVDGGELYFKPKKGV